MISLHSHSGQFCLHAKGNLEDVVLRAIELGFTTYGLSEHVPRSRPQDLYPEESQITPADLSATFAAFVIEARRLQQKYRSQIRLLVGAETEHIHAQTLDELDDLRSSIPLDYVVGSVHHVKGHAIDFDLARYEKAEKDLGGTEALFSAYFDAQCEMLSHVNPLVVGHFDLIRMFRPDYPLSDDVWSKIRQNVDIIKGYGGLVEINSRAWKKGLRDAYPQRDILQYVQAQGIRFTLSDDSHGPADVGMHYGRLHKYLEEMNITSVYYPAISEDGTIGIECIDNIQESPFWSSSS